MQENNLEEKTIKRPWQATLRIWFIVLYLILTYIIFCCKVVHRMFLENTYENKAVLIMDRGVEFIFGIIVNFDLLFITIVLTVVSIVVIIGILKGQRWSLGFSITLTCFFYLFFYREVEYSMRHYDSFLNLRYAGYYYLLNFSLITIPELYLIYYCSKHPFYNQKKVEHKI